MREHEVQATYFHAELKEGLLASPQNTKYFERGLTTAVYPPYPQNESSPSD
jgi:hypothetical protein